MIRAARYLVVTLAAVAAVVAGAVGACNDVGDCPAKATIKPDAACSPDQLQCEYDLSTPSPSCSGPATVIPSSCTCTGGAWVCPEPEGCDAGEDGGDPGDAGADGVAPADAGVDAS